MLHITTLMENRISENKSLVNEHGLSFFVEGSGFSFLFDLGSGLNACTNAHRLGVPVDKADAVVLSHSHYDHAAGYRDYVESGKAPKVLYTGMHFFEPKYAFNGVRYTNLSCGFDKAFLNVNEINHEEVSECREIFHGVHVVTSFKRSHSFEDIPSRFVKRVESTFVPDDFGDEVCIVLETEEGLVVLVGCSHPGILNIITSVHNRFRIPVVGIFGGTHLVEADNKRVETTIAGLKSMGLKYFGLSHCSGDEAECIVHQDIGFQSCHLGVGDEIFFREASDAS